MFGLSPSKTTRHRRFVCLLLTALLAAGGGVRPASAQQPDTVETSTTAETDTLRLVASVERKSPVRAVLYSAGGTFVLTPLFGPSVGHFYANDDAQAWRGIALRVGGFGLAGVFGFVGVAQMQGGGEPRGLTAAKVTLNLISIHALYDIVTAWDSAKDYNETHNVDARVAPTVGPSGEQAGLALRVTF